ncbi:MAG: hypothetical protein ACYC0U_02670, partial [Ilumatobacteraceae bacterium]
DKPVLYTSPRTTPLQDVSRIVVSCGNENQMNIDWQPQFPQSPTLITVISSIHVHPHMAITTSPQRGHGVPL